MPQGAFTVADVKKGQFTVADIDPKGEFDWKYATRKSPLGYDETIYPDNAQFARGAAATTLGDVASFTQRNSSDPETVNHERLHVAQNQLKNQPSAEQVRAAMTPNMLGMVGDLGGGRFPEAEMPAYAFSSVLPEHIKPSKWYHGNEKDFQWGQQESFNNYINLMEKLNPGQSHHILAASPIELQRGYIGSGGPGAAPAPVVNMQPISISDALKY